MVFGVDSVWLNWVKISLWRWNGYDDEIVVKNIYYKNDLIDPLLKKEKKNVKK